MRGKVAKKLRKIVYGDMALRSTRYRQDATKAIFCTGHRGLYKIIKKMYKDGNSLEHIEAFVKEINE